MKQTKLCPIFCLKKGIEIDDFSEMIDWSYNHRCSNTVLILTEDEVKYYQEEGL